MLNRDALLSDVATLLRQAGAAHHQAFLAVNGADPDWPQWYAAYLAAPLGRRLGVGLDQAALAGALAELDRRHRATAPGESWPEFYGERLIAQFSASAA